MEEHKAAPYEEPKVEDYGDLVELTAHRTYSPTHFDGSFNAGDPASPPFS